MKVWDILPVGVDYKSGGSYVPATRNVTWTIGFIGAGLSEDVKLVVTVNVDAVGKLNNTAFANSDENKTPVNKTSDKHNHCP